MHRALLFLVPLFAVALLAALTVLLPGCAMTNHTTVERAAADVAINAVLDDFHAAAAVADGERYFAHFAPDGVFIGTDAAERWTVAEFRAFAKPIFAQGKGWTYHVVERHVAIHPDAGSAWFDERLTNESYGETRGSGALRRIDGTWRIEQYVLSFPIPNEIAKDVVQQIRSR